MKFIFEVRIKPGHTPEQYADTWVRVSRILQQAPGARGTRLHRKIGDPNRLLAIEENPKTNARLRQAGFDLRTFPASELCINGSGGPTCLTRPLFRG